MPSELPDPVLLRTFVSVAERGSFTAAASAGGYTQSAVSRQMASLEDVWGVELFARRARGVRLTPAGEHLLPHAKALLERFSDTIRALDAVRRLDVGHLRIGAFPTANLVLVSGALERFQSRHEGISLALREGTTERLLGLLGAGDLDIAVVSTHKNPDLTGIHLDHLVEDRIHVALSEEHRLASRDEIPMAELADEHWIVADTVEAVSALRATCATAGFIPNTPLRAGEWMVKLELVAGGLGVALIPGMMTPHIPAKIAVRSLAPDPPRRTVYAAVPPHAHRYPAVAAFLADLRSVAADLAKIPDLTPEAKRRGRLPKARRD